MPLYSKRFFKKVLGISYIGHLYLPYQDWTKLTDWLNMDLGGNNCGLTNRIAVQAH